ncbi:hypothetical protein ACO1O0_007586 [Amphichorda felina]
MTSTGIETRALTDGDLTNHGRYGQYHEPVLEADAMRKVVAEGCSMIPGRAAVMLQIAAKGVGRGVSDHSSFTRRPVERARRSIFYIYVMAFGTPAERRRVTDATHRAHMRVKSADYDANDVHLQLWVASTIYWSFICGYEDIYGPLDDDTADRVYREFSVMATGLRVPPDMWPRDREEFKAYFDRTINELEVTDEARAVAREVMYPGQNLPWGFWLLSRLTGPSQRVTTIELLPERIRNELGFPSTFYTRTMYWLRSSMDRMVYPWLPEVVRHYPMQYFMSDFRDRMAKGTGL